MSGKIKVSSSSSSTIVRGASSSSPSSAQKPLLSSSPAADARRVLDGYRVPSSLQKCRFLEYAPEGVVALARHPRGSLTAVARESGDVEIWRTDTIQEGWYVVSTLFGARALSLQALTWVLVDAESHGTTSMEGARLFAGTLKGAVYEADWAAGTLRSCFDSHGGAVWTLSAFTVSGNGSTGYNSAGAAYEAAVESGERRRGYTNASSSGGGASNHEELHLGGSASSSISFSSSGLVRGAQHHPPPSIGSLLAVGCEDGTVRLYRIPHWDVRSGGSDSSSASLLPPSSESSHYAHGSATAAAAATSRDLAPLASSHTAPLPILTSLCRGVDGRVLSLGWHPSLPILYAGTSAGVVHGWDLSYASSFLAKEEVAALSTFLRISGSSRGGGGTPSIQVGSKSSSRGRHGIRGDSASSAAASSVSRKAILSKSGRGASADDDDDDDGDDGGLTAVSKGKEGSKTHIPLGLRQAWSWLSGASTVNPLSSTSSFASSFSSSSASVPYGSSYQSYLSTPPPVVRMVLEGASKADACVWSIAVTSDLCLILGDGRGNVTVWDGRTGVLCSVAPIARHEGDVLSVAVFEEGLASGREGSASRGGEGGEGEDATLFSDSLLESSGSSSSSSSANASVRFQALLQAAQVTTIATSGVDGRVQILKRYAPPAAAGASTGASTAKWIASGSHRGHSHDVRSVILTKLPGVPGGGGSSSGGGQLISILGGGSQSSSSTAFNLCVLSGGADGFLVLQQTALASQALATPRRMPPFSGGAVSSRISISKETSLLAHFDSTTSGGSIHLFELLRHEPAAAQGASSTSSSSTTGGSAQVGGSKRGRSSEADESGQDSNSSSAAPTSQFAFSNIFHGGAGGGGGGIPGDSIHWLSIDPIFSASSAEAAIAAAAISSPTSPTPRSPVTPGAVALSKDASWLAYADIGIGLRLVRLTVTESNTVSAPSLSSSTLSKAHSASSSSSSPPSSSSSASRYKSISPSSVAISEHAASQLRSSGAISKILFLALPASPTPSTSHASGTSACLLLTVSPSKISVFHCFDKVKGGSSGSYISASTTPTLQYLYTLKIPSGVIDPDDSSSAVNAGYATRMSATPIALPVAATSLTSRVSGIGGLSLQQRKRSDSNSSNGGGGGGLLASTATAFPSQQNLLLRSYSINGVGASKSSLAAALRAEGGGAARVDGRAATDIAEDHFSSSDNIKQQFLLANSSLMDHAAAAEHGRQASRRGGNAGDVKTTVSLDRSASVVYITAAAVIPLSPPSFSGSSASSSSGKKAPATASSSGGGGSGAASASGGLLSVSTSTGMIHTYYLSKAVAFLLSSIDVEAASKELPEVGAYPSTGAIGLTFASVPSSSLPWSIRSKIVTARSGATPLEPFLTAMLFPTTTTSDAATVSILFSTCRSGRVSAFLPHSGLLLKDLSLAAGKASFAGWQQGATYAMTSAAPLGQTTTLQQSAKRRHVSSSSSSSAAAAVPHWLDTPSNVDVLACQGITLSSGAQSSSAFSSSPSSYYCLKLLLTGLHFASTVSIALPLLSDEASQRRGSSLSTKPSASTPRGDAAHASQESIAEARLHPLRYSNIVAMSVLDSTLPEATLLEARSSSSSSSGRASLPLSSSRNILLVELPWRTVTKHTTGQLFRKKYAS